MVLPCTPPPRLLGTTCCLILALAAAIGRADAVDVSPAVLLVDDFDDDVQNNVHGYRSAFHKMPSKSYASRDRNVFRGQGGRSLRIAAIRETDGFCGAWIHLFDMRREPPRYLDSGRFTCLSLWVKGRRGGERFTIKLADRRWLDKEDALPIGNASALLPNGVTTDWQELIVPLPGEGQLDCRELGAVILEFTDVGAQTVFFDDLSFKTAAELSVPYSQPPIQPTADNLNYPRALWLWSTASLLHDPSQVASLLQFCQQQRVTQLWAQLDYAFSPPDVAVPDRRETDNPPDMCVLRQQPALRAFLRAAHARGIAVHALDGSPEFARQVQHPMALAVVESVIRFNQAGASDQRFDGIHFDNEPYLLLGWQLPECREQILLEFLELNEKCQQLVSRSSNLRYGVDIPFWWHADDGGLQGSEVDVTFHGSRKPAGLHCIDMLDNVGIMDYRDRADGADGIIAHGRHLLDYADRSSAAGNRGQAARIHIGVETFRNRPTPVWFLLGRPRAEMHRRLRFAEQLMGSSRCEGLRLRTLDDGQCLHVGVELPLGEEGGPLPNTVTEQAERALRRVADQLQLASPAIANQASAASLRQLSESLAKSNEWSEFRPRSLPVTNDGAANEGTVPGFTVTSQMLSKITFADDSIADLHEQLGAAEEYFQRYRSYGGIAIHYYETYRELVERDGGTADTSIKIP